MSFPNFLIVGAEKCGTTALYAHLAAHPQAFMSRVKEPSYFASFDPRYVGQRMGKLKPSFVRDEGEYRALFAEAGDCLVRGEASPCYLYSTVAPQKIHEAIPDAKIAILLRHPAERAWSQFLYNQQKGWESLATTFEQALAWEARRVEHNEMWAFHYKARGCYYQQVKRYRDLFGENNVRAWLYRDFNAKPARVLAELHEWLGLAPILPDDLTARHNPTRVPRSRLLQHLTQRSNPIKSTLKRLLPEGAGERISRRVRRLNTVVPRPRRDLLNRLLESLAGDVEELATVIDPNPKVWLEDLYG